MAHKIDNIVSKHTECAICLMSYTRPKQLQPCLHSFCEPCIEQWATRNRTKGRRFPCPICKANIEIPQGGVQNFQNNIIINNLVDDLSKLTINEETCETHPDEVLNLICEQCNVYICVECTENHIGHAIRSLKAVLKSTQLDTANNCHSTKKIYDFDPSMKVNDITVTGSGSIIAASGEVVKCFTTLGKLKWESQLPIAYVTFYNDFLYGISQKLRVLYKVRFIDGQVLETTPIPFEDPLGIAFNSKGDLYIISGDNNGIYRKENDQRTFTKFPKKKQLCCPLYLAISADDSVIVSEYYGGSVTKFNKNGDLMWSYDGQYLCTGVTVDPKGDVFLANAAYSLFIKLSQNGTEISITNPYAWDHPRAVALWNSNKLLIGGDNRIVLLQL